MIYEREIDHNWIDIGVKENNLMIKTEEENLLYNRESNNFQKTNKQLDNWLIHARTTEIKIKCSSEKWQNEESEAIIEFMECGVEAELNQFL